MWALARDAQRAAIVCFAFDLIPRALTTYNDDLTLVHS